METEHMAGWPPEEVIRLNDRESGLEGVIVLHSTRAGPAAGGCRLWHYPSLADGIADAMRLAEGMSYKNAMADLPLGGGKAVIVKPAGNFDRRALFRAFGGAVESLGGRYVTAEDVGTSVDDMACVAERSRHVAGLTAKPGAPGGDPSPWTALGVMRAMEAAVRRRLGKPLSEVSVAVHGLGHVGFALCELLYDAGARLVVSELRSDVAAAAAVRFDPQVSSSSALIDAPVDVFAPCALGGVLTADTVRRLKAKVVCGAANNQLAGPELDMALARRGILYAPDFVVNAGGIINVAAEYLGWSEAEVRTRIDRTGVRLATVLTFAADHGLAPGQAAQHLARMKLARYREPPLAA